MNTIIRSKRVLTNGTIEAADILIEAGLISRIEPYNSLAGGHDFGTQLIVPGFVDLHSDAVEKEIEPRPGASFPLEQAISDLDKKLAMSGITTMFHAVAFNDESIVTQRGTEMAAEIIRRITAANRHHLSVDNLVHARYEITSLGSARLIEKLIEEQSVHLLSVMNHTPGQGQFKSTEMWKRFHLPVYDLSDAQADEIIRDKQNRKAEAGEQMRKLLEFGTRFNIRLLSHDDDCSEKIDLLRCLGVTISEFPLNSEVALYAKSRGMGTGMGAPNVVRGKSQSGNISARELIAAGGCDFLCSDYHPSSMLQAPYILAKDLGMELAEAFAMITSVPSRLAGLTDRGSIEKGKLADIVIIDDHWLPKITVSMKEGSLIYNTTGCLSQAA